MPLACANTHQSCPRHIHSVFSTLQSHPRTLAMSDLISRDHLARLGAESRKALDLAEALVSGPLAALADYMTAAVYRGLARTEVGLTAGTSHEEKECCCVKEEESRRERSKTNAHAASAAKTRHKGASHACAECVGFGNNKDQLRFPIRLFSVAGCCAFHHLAASPLHQHHHSGSRVGALPRRPRISRRRPAQRHSARWGGGGGACYGAWASCLGGAMGGPPARSRRRACRRRPAQQHRRVHGVSLDGEGGADATF